MFLNNMPLVLVALKVRTLFHVCSPSLVAQALGVDIIGMIARWTNDNFHLEQTGTTLQSTPKTVLPPEENFKSLQAALTAFDVTEPLAPTWIPERYELKSIALQTISTQKISALASMKKMKKK